MNAIQQQVEAIKIRLYAAREKRARLESSYMRDRAAPDANKERLFSFYIPKLAAVNADIINLSDSLDADARREVNHGMATGRALAV